MKERGLRPHEGGQRKEATVAIRAGDCREKGL